MLGQRSPPGSKNQKFGLRASRNMYPPPPATCKELNFPVNKPLMENGIFNSWNFLVGNCGGTLF